MDKISAALDSPIGRLVDNASPKIGAVTTMVAGTSWYMAIPWDNVVLITSAIGGVFFAVESVVCDWLCIFAITSSSERS